MADKLSGRIRKKPVMTLKERRAEKRSRVNDAAAAAPRRKRGERGSSP